MNILDTSLEGEAALRLKCLEMANACAPVEVSTSEIIDRAQRFQDFILNGYRPDDDEDGSPDSDGMAEAA